MTESKIDMGLLDVVSGTGAQVHTRASALKKVLKSWDALKSAPPQDEDLRETGT